MLELNKILNKGMLDVGYSDCSGVNADLLLLFKQWNYFGKKCVF